MPRGRRVEFTSWLSVLWVPLVPLASWSAVYAGEGLSDGVTDEAHQFADARRVLHDWGQNLRTFLASLCVTAVAVAPAVAMIARTEGRAATKLEMVFVLASPVWAAGMILWSVHRQRRRLRDG